MIFNRVSVKRTFALFTAALLMLTFAGCEKDASTESDKSVDVVLITDYGTIDDNSYNQGAWDGVKQYAEEAGIAYEYY